MSEPIRAVERALEVLLCFTMQSPELSMTQIAEKVNMHKSTVHRLLATLERMRFVQRDPLTGIYRPGIRLLQMAYLTLEHNDLRQLAAPFLRRLCEQFRETVDLCVLDGNEVIFVDVVESPQRVKLAASTGQRLPAFCTASGKAILAFLPDEKVKRILGNGMPPYTQKTLLSPQAFFEDIYPAREQGFATSEQEFEEGINAVAAPILDFSSQPVAAIAIAGPAYRLTRERMLKIGPQVVIAAGEVAQELGMSARPRVLDEDVTLQGIE